MTHSQSLDASLNPTVVDAESVVAALGTHYGPAEAHNARVLKEYGGTVPDEQLISEAALALAIQRWQRPE